MENIIKYTVECGSWYGVVALVIVLIGFISLLVFAYKTIRFILPFTSKGFSKFCNTLIKYKDFRTKASVKDVSIETELHR
ncbi:MAG: hypothetical protein IJA10_10215 [Lachnospiraceae bacterium]|nr:hypothetical protein [Lachnospiraceae bacterium]